MVDDRVGTKAVEDVFRFRLGKSHMWKGGVVGGRVGMEMCLCFGDGVGVDRFCPQ